MTINVFGIPFSVLPGMRIRLSWIMRWELPTIKQQATSSSGQWLRGGSCQPWTTYLDFYTSEKSTSILFKPLLLRVFDGSWLILILIKKYKNMNWKYTTKLWVHASMQGKRLVDGKESKDISILLYPYILFLIKNLKQ